jgi:hypothetical protein
MQNRETYEFAIIRIVPKVEREEFLNVGVILFSKRKKYLKMTYQIDEKRMAAFSSKIDVAALNEYLKGWEQVCQGVPNGGKIGEFDLAFRFRWLTASRSTIIQSSKTHPGLCDNPQKELEDLFEMFVL